MIISLLLLFVMVLSVSATFAADEDAALSEVDDEVTIDQDVLSVQEDNEPLSVEDEEVVEADDGFDDVLKEGNVVTNDTFHNYFDDSGNLLDTVTDDELIFEGDFSGIDVNYITIDREIKFAGKNAIFNGVSFVISSDDVEITGFDLTGSDYALITMSEVSNVIISDCKINFTAVEDSDSYAIYAFSVDTLKIINNNITYVGCTNGNYINNVIRIEGDEDEELSSNEIVIQKNNFDITLPSVAIKHPDMYSLENTKIFSAGIDLFYCYDVNIIDNEMNIKYNNHYGNLDSIVGISVRGNPMNLISEDPIVSEDVLIKNNVIKATGYNYIYGILIAGNDFEVSDNQLTISSDNYYANAIEVEGPSEEGTVKNNTISLKAPGATYGIISGVLTMGIIDGVNYVDNTIDVESYFACGMELSQWDSEVTNNNISVKGNYTVGICDSVHNGESTISKNTIECFGTNIGDDPTGDTILGKESIAIAVLGDVTIENNNISSTNVGIEAVEEGTVVIRKNDINVIANTGKIDNFAIVASEIDDLTIINNNVTFNGMVDYQFVTIGYDDWGYPIYDTSNNTHTYGVFIKNSDVKIVDNNFDIAIPTFAVNWGATRESFSEGIVLAGCDDAVLSNNNITISANGGNSWDTIYGIDILNSANPTIVVNDIVLNGAGYSYGILINDELFKMYSNNITVTSDEYACGIDVEGAAKGEIEYNIVTATATNSAYPIYTGMVAGQDVVVSINNNEIKGEAYYVVGLEIAASEAHIYENVIYVDGNHTIGIGTKVSKVEIKDNIVNAFASNVGDQPVWDSMKTDNCGIKVISGNAIISNNKIASNAIGINADSTNDIVKIIDNDIVVNANSGKVNNYAIVAEEVDLTIINNNVTFNGMVDNQFVIIGYDDWGYPIYDSSNNTRSYAVFVKNSDLVIRDNDFDIAIPTFAVNWGATRESFSEGIVIVGCDDAILNHNNITISTNGGTSWDTIYGIDILNSADAKVVSNDILVKGAGYTYAIIINDEYFVISDNNITVTSDEYACGIDVEGAAEGIIVSNNIGATATNSAYPIYSGMNYMPVTITIQKNNITGEAYYVVGVEVGGTEAEIIENDIKVSGNHTMGIGAYIDEITIDNNNITSNPSKVGDQPVWDQMGIVDAGVVIKKGNFTINDNVIYTTGDYAAVLGDNNGTITNNKMTSNEGEGDMTIIGLGNITSSGNTGVPTDKLKVVIAASGFAKVYGTDDFFKVKLLDEYGRQLFNKTVMVSVGGQTFINVTDEFGDAVFNINVVPEEYVALIKFDGDADYSYKSIYKAFVIEKAPSVITAPDKSLLVTATKSGVNYQIVLKDNSGNVLANQKVTINGKEYTADDKGVVNYKITASKAGTQKLTVNFAGDAYYAASTKTATIKINKEATKLTAKKKTFKAKVKTKKYTVTLKDSKGKAIKKVKVTLKVKGKKYTAKTNAKGKATFKIKKLTKKGKYTAKVKFAGNNLYKAASKSVKITVKK